MTDTKSFPADFPRAPMTGAVPGAQPKLLVHKLDGRYVVGPTDREVLERYGMCQDLVEQLVDYCQRKLQERPQWTPEVLLQKVRAGVGRKGWDVSPLELAWVIGRLAHLLADSCNENRSQS